MLLAEYKQAGLLYYTNFLEETSESGIWGYRGDLVLVEGEAGDEMGHAKPPREVMRGAVLLADEKLKMVLGGLDLISSLGTFVEKYKAGFTPETLSLIFVVNLKNPCKVEMDGISFVLIPLVQGVPWNETMEELRLEKSDFKGQSPADKLVTMYQEMKDYSPKYPTVTYEEALADTTNAVREVWGAV